MDGFVTFSNERDRFCPIRVKNIREIAGVGTHGDSSGNDNRRGRVERED